MRGEKACRSLPPAPRPEHTPPRVKSTLFRAGRVKSICVYFSLPLCNTRLEACPAATPPHPGPHCGAQPRLTFGCASLLQALDHPYVAQFHDPSAERVADFAVTVPIDDKEKKTTGQYRSQLYEHMLAADASKRGRSTGRSSQSGERSNREKG